MNLISSVYAQSTTAQTQVPAGTPAGAPQQPGFMSMITLFGPMFLVIYFFIIRPQQKKLKDQQTLVDKLSQGDEVVTSAGMFGRITGITDKVLTLEIADGVRVKMLKTQVSGLSSAALGNGAGAGASKSASR